MKMTAEERGFHRKVAAQAFNRSWDYLDMKKRTPDDDRELLHLAHASRYHWGLVGEPKNLAVGDWLLSRAYGEIGEPRLALRFAQSSLATCKKAKLGNIVHTANEAMARAYALSGDFSRARGYLDVARGQLKRLQLDKEDRKIFLGQIEQTGKLIPGG